MAVEVSCLFPPLQERAEVIYLNHSTLPRLCGLTGHGRPWRMGWYGGDFWDRTQSLGYIEAVHISVKVFQVIKSQRVHYPTVIYDTNSDLSTTGIRGFWGPKPQDTLIPTTPHYERWNFLLDNLIKGQLFSISLWKCVSELIMYSSHNNQTILQGSSKVTN